MSEREIVAPVDLCLPDGTLNPDAVGWSRTPLHNANLRRWGRNKRWEYWCVQTPTHVLALTISSIDYLALRTIWFREFGRSGGGAEYERTAITPLGGRSTFPPTSGVGAVRTNTLGVRIAMVPDDRGIRLAARAPGFECDIRVLRPTGHEAMGVVIPWSERTFQYTLKDNTLPAQGQVQVEGATFEFPPKTSWAVLDHGRGRWPYRTTWNWASGAGRTDEHIVGLQFGGKWTEGTGMTENALCIDGVTTKIGEELIWDYDPDDWMAPWHVRTGDGDGVNVVLTPAYERAGRTQAVVIATEVHQCFGTWSGHVRSPTGERIDLDHIVGFAEETRMRW